MSPLVCSWCSQAYGPYETPDDAPYCFWPFEHPNQSHGLCHVCSAAYRGEPDPTELSLMDWFGIRNAHVARAKEIMLELLSPRPKRRKRGAA